MPFPQFDRSQLNILPLGDRIHDLRIANVALSQLSYRPVFKYANFTLYFPQIKSTSGDCAGLRALPCLSAAYPGLLDFFTFDS